MNIKLSAVEAWQEANAPYAYNDEAVEAATKMVTNNIFKRLKAGQPVNYLYEIGKIIQDTDDDQKTRYLLLHQIMGIAEQQGVLTYETVEEQVENITMERRLAL